MNQTRNIQPFQDVAVVTRNPFVGSAVAEALRQGQTRLRVLSDGLREGCGDALFTHLPQLAIIDVDLENESERREMECVIAAFSDRVAFVVTSAKPTIEGLRILLRHGIADLLPQPLVADEVLRAVAIAFDASRRKRGAEPGGAAKPPRNTVVSVIRAGGGVGATAIAIQAACAIAKGRLAGGQVCLLDFDLQFGSAAFQLALPQRSNLLDLIAAGDRFDGAMLKTTMARHPAGIDVLPAPPGIHPLDVLTPDLAVALVAEARRNYALTVIDLPACWTEWTRAVLTVTDGVLLVLQPEVISLGHAKRQIETLREEGLDQVPLRVVANRVPRGLFGNAPSVKDMETAIGRRIDHVVPLDEHFQDAVTQGKTLAELGAGRIAKRLAALFDGLVLPVPASA